MITYSCPRWGFHREMDNGPGQGLNSLSGKITYHQVLQHIEATRYQDSPQQNDVIIQTFNLVAYAYCVIWSGWLRYSITISHNTIMYHGVHWLCYKGVLLYSNGIAVLTPTLMHRHYRCLVLNHQNKCINPTISIFQPSLSFTLSFALSLFLSLSFALSLSIYIHIYRLYLQRPPWSC